MAKTNKRRAYRFGIIAEYLCIFLLVLKGYRIIARRYKTPVGEIDIAARTKDALICIEVKARKHQEDGLYAIAPHQQQRIIQASQYMIASHHPHASLALRFDVMVVSTYGFITHIKHAFDAS